VYIASIFGELFTASGVLLEQDMTIVKGYTIVSCSTNFSILLGNNIAFSYKCNRLHFL
jgi:hypothetical protein